MTDDHTTTDDAEPDYDTIPLDTEDYNHLCWYVVREVDTFAPPEERAAETIDAVSDDHDDWDATNAAWEHGYYAGAFSMMEGLAKFMDAQAGDGEVLNRATHFADTKGLTDFDTVTDADAMNDAVDQLHEAIVAAEPQTTDVTDE